MEPALEEKQKYLRTQILQSSYDPDEFIGFLCKDLSIEQLALENISMPTLQSIVLKFKQYKYYQEQPKQEKKVKIEYDKSTYDYQFEAKWKCINAEKVIEDLEVFVPSFEIKQIEGVFFSIGSRTEIWFIVQSNISKHHIKRQAEDFQWLSQSISRMYPILAIPQLIPVAKEAQGNHQKRRKQFQQYLQILAKRKELKISNLFYEFLTLPYQKIEKFKKNWDTQSFAKGIQSIKNQQGILKVSYTNKLRNYVQNTSAFNRKSQIINENISLSLSRASQYLTVAADEINKVVEMFAELHESYNELINKNPEQKINEYNDILININNLFHLISGDIISRSKIMSTNLKQYHKIQLSYNKSISKLHKNVMETEKQYVYLKSNLNKKKQKIFPDISRWQVDQKLLQNRRLSKQEAFDVMLPKQTETVTDIRDWTAYLYNNYKQQFEKYIGYEVSRFVNIYCIVCSQLLINNKNYVQEVTKFIEESKRIETKKW